MDLQTLMPGILAIVILVDLSVMWLTGRPVPDLLSSFAWAVFGFYFGAHRPTAGARLAASGQLRDDRATKRPTREP